MQKKSKPRGASDKAKMFGIAEDPWDQEMEVCGSGSTSISKSSIQQPRLGYS